MNCAKSEIKIEQTEVPTITSLLESESFELPTIQDFNRLVGLQTVNLGNISSIISDLLVKNSTLIYPGMFIKIVVDCPKNEVAKRLILTLRDSCCQNQFWLLDSRIVKIENQDPSFPADLFMIKNYSAVGKKSDLEELVKLMTSVDLLDSATISQPQIVPFSRGLGRSQILTEYFCSSIKSEPIPIVNEFNFSTVLNTSDSQNEDSAVFV